jgi:hypothetical protein
MVLPPELEKAFKNDLATYEEGKNMLYISNLERESREAGKAEMVIKQLGRWGQLSPEILAKIEALPVDRLEKLGEDLLDFTGSKDLADWLQQYGD